MDMEREQQVARFAEMSFADFWLDEMARERDAEQKAAMSTSFLNKLHLERHSLAEPAKMKECLELVGVNELWPSFEKAEITLNLLPYVREEELVELGAKSLHQRVVVRRIAEHMKALDQYFLSLDMGKGQS